MEKFNDYEERVDLDQGDYIVAGSTDFESLLEKKTLKYWMLK